MCWVDSIEVAGGTQEGKRLDSMDVLEGRRYGNCIGYTVRKSPRVDSMEVILGRKCLLTTLPRN